MKTAPPSRRDRLRHILADLRMPGSLEALDAILPGVDGGTLTAPEAIEQLLSAQIQSDPNRRARLLSVVSTCVGSSGTVRTRVLVVRGQRRTSACASDGAFSGPCWGRGIMSM
jgi:hypothetical protein